MNSNAINLVLIVLIISFLLGLVYLDNVYAERNISYSANFKESMKNTPFYNGSLILYQNERPVMSDYSVCGWVAWC